MAVIGLDPRCEIQQRIFWYIRCNRGRDERKGHKLQKERIDLDGNHKKQVIVLLERDRYKSLLTPNLSNLYGQLSSLLSSPCYSTPRSSSLLFFMHFLIFSPSIHHPSYTPWITLPLPCQTLASFTNLNNHPSATPQI